MSAGLLAGAFSFPGLGSGVTSSSACSSSGGHASQSNGSDLIDFGKGIKFPRFLDDLTRKQPLASLAALVLIVLAVVFLLSGGSGGRRRRRRGRSR